MEDNRISKNKGFLSVEASIVLPLFMLFIYTFIMFCKVIMVRSVIYEAALVETAEYMAEYAYLSEKSDILDYSDYFVASTKVAEYIDDKALVNQLVKGGTSGISLLGSRLPDEDGNIVLHVRYTVSFSIPFIGRFKSTYSDRIKQKAYLGYMEDSDEETKEDDIYVYIAENGVVYHHSRRCTYLYRETEEVTVRNAKKRGYSACSYCDGAYPGIFVYITEDGDKYHSGPYCSRLLRTVRRVKLKNAGGLPECQKCK
ncbi:hypothetical protein SAMN04487934_10256 [Eubacterium ruminantium]|nr:hypothetical protein SAMN04487934_10256 [Eubacterium ruminantium]